MTQKNGIEVLRSSPREAAPRLRHPPSTTSTSPSRGSPSNLLVSDEFDAKKSSNQAQKGDLCSRAKQAFGLSSQLPPGLTYKYKVPPRIRTLDEYPVGYPQLAAFEDCDPAFLICRKFGWLHTRLLLHLQDDLEKLEWDLEQVD
ncbi:hypothetical protein HO173_004431 [Letharia columbiana]|uniref:DUF6594 domain-containing protein n=1 Tax=Letharia columbiana TaxID=112416 RepID=A0A8H6L6P8_9LECA|nr:uncharacterized protein HO173_004431 [Letharia columbiana]KAF6237541.1 hypothetical protein HO173_004431 [Letharia columbiana]